MYTNSIFISNRITERLKDRKTKFGLEKKEIEEE